MVIKAINDRDTHNEFFIVGNVFLDGSGGIYSSDPRLRACGCAWFQPFADDRRARDQWDGIGMYASVPGKQTVPRSEAYALIIFLHFIPTLFA